MAPKLVLTYFSVTGRAECARLMLRVAGVEFEDVKLEVSKFREENDDVEKYPLRQIPTLQVDDYLIVQSNAIHRYVANEYGFYGANSIERSVIDQVVETLNEQFGQVMPIMYRRSYGPDEKTVKYKELFEQDQTKRCFNYVTKLLKASSGGKEFFLGSKVSFADILMYSHYDKLFPEYPVYLDPYPELKALMERVGAIEAIKKHLETRKYTEAENVKF